MAFRRRPERPRSRVASAVGAVVALVFVGFTCGLVTAPQWTLDAFGLPMFAFFTLGPLVWWIVATVGERRRRARMIREGRGDRLRRIERWRRLDEWLYKPNPPRPPDV